VSKILEEPEKIADALPVRRSNSISQRLSGLKFWPSIRPELFVPLIVACALLMENVDGTVITTSLPMIARDLGKDAIVLKLGLTSYLVSLAVFIPISGWMADRFGGRTVFCVAIATFMVSSMLCGMAHTFIFFVAARFLQGIGGAMMVPVGRIVIVRTVSREELVTALNYLTVPALLGPLVGPPLGGFITTYLSWRWIFFINVPISILGIFLAVRYMDNIREDVVPPLDVIGFLTSATGLSLLMFGLSTITERLLPREFAVASIVIGAVITYVYFRLARRTETPLLDLGLFKIKTFLVGVGGGSLFRIGVGSIAFLLPLVLQLGFGMSPLQSGMLTCASAIGALFMKSAIKMVLRVFGFPSVLAYNALLCGISVVVIALFTARTSHWIIFVVLLLGGCVRTLQFTALNAITYADIPDQIVSQATSMYATVQQLSLGMGVTVGAFALQASSFLQRHDTIVTRDFWPAFVAMGLIAGSSAYSAFTLPADAGAEMAGRPTKAELEAAAEIAE
jgi:EmrB/QacA subfamily drug resistance transporter